MDMPHFWDNQIQIGIRLFASIILEIIGSERIGEYSGIIGRAPAIIGKNL